jgi:diadenosine tetraphosphate (Ap4A) HIT family hydrolase
VVVPIEVDDSCTLCRLISGQLERSVVYEDAQVVAFMDHQPVNPGHVLVVPGIMRCSWTSSMRTSVSRSTALLTG